MWHPWGLGSAQLYLQQCNRGHAVKEKKIGKVLTWVNTNKCKAIERWAGQWATQRGNCFQHSLCPHRTFLAPGLYVNKHKCTGFLPVLTPRPLRHKKGCKYLTLAQKKQNKNSVSQALRQPPVCGCGVSKHSQALNPALCKLQLLTSTQISHFWHCGSIFDSTFPWWVFLTSFEQDCYTKVNHMLHERNSRACLWLNHCCVTFGFSHLKWLVTKSTSSPGFAHMAWRTLDWGWLHLHFNCMHMHSNCTGTLGGATALYWRFAQYNLTHLYGYIYCIYWIFFTIFVLCRVLILLMSAV